MSETNLLDLGDGLAVRAMRASDAKSMARHANDADISRQMRDRFPSPYNVSDAEVWISMWQNQSNWKPSTKGLMDPRDISSSNSQVGEAMSTTYVITLNDEAIGGIGLDFRSDVERKTAELGYWIGKVYWGRGYASKIITAFAKWTFDTWSYLVRLESHTYATNPASGRVLEKCGFVREGTLRASVFKHGQVLDSHVWSYVRPDLAA